MYPTKRTRCQGWLRRSFLLSFVVGILACSLVVTMPSVAEADGVTYGPTVGPVTLDAGGKFVDVKCNVSAKYAVTAVNGQGSMALNYTASCTPGFLIGGVDGATIGTMNIAIVFQGNVEGTSQGCIMSGLPFSGYLASNATTSATTLGCHVTQVCESWQLQSKFWPDGSAEICTSFDMGTPNSTGTSVDPTCWIGTMAQAWWWTTSTYRVASFNLTAYASGLTAQSTSVLSSRWVPYVIFSDGSRAGFALSSNTITYPGTGYGEFGGDKLKEPTNGVYASWAAAFGTETTSGTHGTVVGVGIMQDNNTSGVTPGVIALPQEQAGGKIGVTDPANCSFYWGAKVADLPNSTMDDPIGPLLSTGGGSVTAPPTPTNGGGGCTFSLSDPSTWASGGMCAAVGLLGRIVGVLGDILSAIGHLAGDIASAITSRFSDLLTSLFVPSNPPSFGDVHFNVAPGWLPSLPGPDGSGSASASLNADTSGNSRTGDAPASASVNGGAVSGSSCGPIVMPTIRLGFRDTHGADTLIPQKTLVDTCSAPWPTVRLFTYNGLLAVVLVTVVRIAFGALLSALGANVQGGGLAAVGDPE